MKASLRSLASTTPCWTVLLQQRRCGGQDAATNRHDALQLLGSTGVEQRGGGSRKCGKGWACCYVGIGPVAGSVVVAWGRRDGADGRRVGEEKIAGEGRGQQAAV